MLKRIKIQGYKSLIDMEVELKPLTVIFGPNASGKSNFVDALQILSGIFKTIHIGIGNLFAPPHRGGPLESFTFGPHGISDLLREEKVSLSIETDFVINAKNIKEAQDKMKHFLKISKAELANDEKEILNKYFEDITLRYFIEVNMKPKTGALELGTEKLEIQDQNGCFKPLLILKDNIGFYYDDDIQEYPREIKNCSFLPMFANEAFRSPFYLYCKILKSELDDWIFSYLEPRVTMRMPTPVRETRNIALMGEDLSSFLNTLKEEDPFQFESIEKALNRIIPSVTGIHLEINKKGDVELSIIEGDRLIPASVVSEGTLRVLGLLSLGAMKDPPALIGLEEPENGVHPRRIRLIAEYLKTQAMLGDTQIIVTTHSPTLIDLIPEESLYVCTRKEGNTQIKPFSSLGLSKRNGFDKVMDDEDETLISERILRGDLDA
jgi:predicted ATPase